MKNFDKNVKLNLLTEEIEVPSHISQKIKNTLEALPEKENLLQKHSYPTKGWILAACLTFFFLAFMPNVSITYAQTIQNIPIVGDIIKVFTIRKDFYKDEKHELNAEIPKVEDNTNEAGANLINKNIEELSTMIIQKFYEDIELGKDGYGSIYIDYEVITNDAAWFTLKLNVNEVTGSSDSYAKYYHINRVNGAYVQLKDILSETQRKAIKEYLFKTMKDEMKQDKNIVYFIDDNIEIVQDDSNFYFNENRDLVITYNKYDIAPGYIGCPEFVIPKDIYMN